MPQVTLSEEYLVDISGTSDGSQDKYNKDGFWYKQDSRTDEGYNEALASKILMCSNLSPCSYVEYEQVEINGIPGCKSPEFKEPDEVDVSIYRLYANTRGGDMARALQDMDMDDGIEFTLEFMKQQTGLDLRTYIANMISFDQLILNCDRHLNNISVLFNSRTGEFREAPIYDNGRSFFCGVRKFDPAKSIRENIKQVMARPFSPSFA